MTADDVQRALAATQAQLPLAALTEQYQEARAEFERALEELEQ